MQKNGGIKGFPGAQSVDNGDELLCHECDILIPAAAEKAITRDNMKGIKAKIIGEAANGPITPTADEYITSQGKIILPDLLLNAGGVTVSYFEWLKNLSHVRFGRLTRKWEQQRGRAMLSYIEDELDTDWTESHSDIVK